jgi:hypothetical protein
MSPIGRPTRLMRPVGASVASGHRLAARLRRAHGRGRGEGGGPLQRDEGVDGVCLDEYARACGDGGSVLGRKHPKRKSRMRRRLRPAMLTPPAAP